MTTPDVPDASEADELASALVDGEATAAEQARADDPEVAARVEAFQAVARLVATPVEPVDDLARSRAIRAAVAEAAAPAPAAPARRMPTWLAPAAAVIVVLAGFGLFLAAIAGSSSDGEDSAASSGADTAAEATIAAGGGGGESFEETADDLAGGATAEAPASTLADADLGAFDEPPQLADALRARLERTPAAEDGSVQRSAELDAVGCSGAFEASTVLDVVRATLYDRPVLVVVLQRADGRLSYAAVAEPTCETLAAGDL